MIRKWIATLDQLLVLAAAPCGACVQRPLWRYGLLVGLYGGVYGACLIPLPGVPLAALAGGYLTVLAMGRAWVANERTRAKIAKKLIQGNPDELPDLRGAALFSALQLALLFPLLFQQLQHDFRLFRVPEGTTLLTWLAFTFDSVCKLFVNVAEIYDVSFTRIEYASSWGRHLVLIKRLTIEYLLIQGVIRFLDIRSKIREAVAAIPQDVDMAVRLGQRAVPALTRLLSDPDAELRRQAARALGMIGSSEATEPLRRLLQDDCPSVREAAAQALGELGDPHAVEPLIQVLQKVRSEKIVLYHDRQKAAESLGNLGDERAIEPLVRVLQERPGDALASVREALAKIQGRQQLAEAGSARG
jgi:hypothetical protein